MRLNSWRQWLIALVTTLLWLPEGVAQYDPKPVSELDKLRLWFPIYPSSQPSTLANQPYSYANITELVQKAKSGEKVEAVSLAGFVMKQEDLASLSQLQTVRVLYVNDLTVSQFDSLCQIIQRWPALERMSVSAYLPTPTTQPIRLPQNIQHFPKLHDVRINGNGLQWDESFKSLANLKTLRSLDINNWNAQNNQPTTLIPLPQLNELKIQGQSWTIKPETFAALKQLSRLTLSNVRIDTIGFQQVISGLLDLDTLALQNIPLLRKLNLSGLKKLRSLELSFNPNLTLTATSLTNLPALEQLIVLNAQSVDLSSLCSLIRLRTLIVNGQGKKIEIPDCLDQLTQLAQLRIENVDLTRFPASIGMLKQLQKLYITFCRIDTIPAAVFNQLTNLQELSLMGNKLRSLPAIGSLRALHQLNLDNNQLTMIPDDIGQLSQLTSLHFNRNKLTQLPASIGRLTALKTLDLTSNQLTKLPSEISKLRKLSSITLGNNQLTALPDNIGQLDSLQGLTIGANKLRALPASVSQLKNLKYIQIGANELTTLPDAIGSLKQLTNLSIDSNPLTELPASISELQNLQSLYIINTKLRLLPDDIGNLSKLTSVVLTNNELIALPQSIGRWKAVTAISLQQNKIEGLPNSIGQLTKLRELTISGKEKAMEGATGGIQQLPDSLVYCDELARISILNQPQLDPDDVFTKLARMKRMNSVFISNCNISHLPEIAWKDVHWQMLNISQNALTELPTGLLDAPELRTIMAQENHLPESLNRNFNDKEALRVAFVEAGKLSLESLPKPNRKITNAFQQMAVQKARQRDWTDAMNDLKKAIEFAPDTILAFPYAQRAGMHFFRKEYAEALADYDKAIQYAPMLRKEKSPDTLLVNRVVASYWQQKAAVLGATSQYDAALTAITKAESYLSPTNDQTPMSGLIYTERGRYLSLKNKTVEADSSYRKAIRAYEKLPYAEPGLRLTAVELSILTGQYDRAKKAIDNLPADQIREGYDVLKEYLDRCVAVLKNEQTATQAMEGLTTYLTKHPAKIYGWSFDLFDNWLNKTKLPAEKVTALRQLTDATKERLVKPQ